MEDTLVSIDSKYRDFTKYPNESNFTLNFEKIYKNIVSVKLVSLELTNSINYISSTKNNNYLTLHFPNILNDPTGVKLSINDTQLQNIDTIISYINDLLDTNLLDESAERYFYIFYLNNNTQLTFDFNSNTLPSILKTKLTLTAGWYSVYGLNLIIKNYIQSNYDARKSFVSSNPNASTISLDSGNFTISTFTLSVFDRRSGSNARNDVYSGLNCSGNNLTNNFTTFKNDLYSFYVNNTTTFIPNSSGTGVLDILLDTLGSTYYINSTNTNPATSNTMLYKLSISNNPNILKVSFKNNFLNYYYTTDDWTTKPQFSTTSITLYDIPQFQIDFNTEGSTSSSFTNNIININSFNYPSIGYYLGYRLVNNSFVLSPSLSGVTMTLTATKNFNVLGEDYIFLRINDWGSFDFFNKVILSKIFLRSDLTTSNKTNNYTNKEYVFRQLTNINRLDIELIDYLGNTVELNGIDFSFTLALRTQANISQKQLFENNNKNF